MLKSCNSKMVWIADDRLFKAQNVRDIALEAITRYTNHHTVLKNGVEMGGALPIIDDLIENFDD